MRGTLGWRSLDPAEAVAAVHEIENKEQLRQIAFEARNPEARRLALLKLRDPELLKSFAENDPSPIVRRRLVREIADADLLRRIAEKDEDYSVVQSAEKRLQALTERKAPEAEDGVENLEWEEVSCEHIVRDEWIDFRKQAFRLPDGSVFSPYYTYSRRDYVVIVASDEEGKYICVRQYRQGIRAVTTEFVAGGIERKDGKQYGERERGNTEDALSAAKRELAEETGYTSDRWRHLMTIPSNATIADNYAFVFEAENCRRTEARHLDDTEFLNVKRYSAEEIEQMIESGTFLQAMHVMAWLLHRRSTDDSK